MSCPGPAALACYASRRLSPSEAAELEAHLAACRDCLEDLGDLGSLSAPPRSWRWPLAVAASLLVAVGLAAPWRKGPEPRLLAGAPARREASLEVSPGGDAALSGSVLLLRAGACWLDTAVPVEMKEPCPIRFEAGTEAEIRILPAPKAVWSLLGEAWASGLSTVLVSVVSGSAEAGGERIPAGSRLRIPGGRLEPVDAGSIDAWRTRSLEAGSRGPERMLADGSAAFPGAPGSFRAEIRAVRGHVVVRYPAGETMLGSLEAWKDGAWHRLVVTWKGSGTEIFLDGRRLLKLPGTDGSGIPGLEVRTGSLVLREIRP